MKILFGSHNYNLNTASSDIDLLVIKVPTIEELYDNTNINTITISEDEDVRYSDIRMINNMVLKPHLNTVEYFTSSRVEFSNKDMEELYFFLRSTVPDIINLTRYQIALRLVAYMKRKLEESIKSSESRAKSIEMYRYDIKSLYAFFRNNIILDRLLSGETDADKLLKFHGHARKFIVSIKTGGDKDYDFLYKEAKKILEKRIELMNMVLIPAKIKEEKENKAEYYEKVIDPVARRVKETTIKLLKESVGR
ncbi:MAG: hypothetical protein ACRDD8_16380 [Bacteroidales bacterium]